MGCNCRHATLDKVLKLSKLSAKCNNSIYVIYRIGKEYHYTTPENATNLEIIAKIYPDGKIETF